MEEEFINGQMDKSMKDNIKMIKSTDMAVINSKMEKNTLENG
jgi:hypothetical protein